MPHFDHTGPQGMGARSGRGMGQCMNRGANARNAAERGMSNAHEPAQTAEPGMGQSMGQGMGKGQNNGQGRCCRHGQRHNNRARNCGMNGNGAGMGQGMRRGKGAAPTCQAESCGAGPAAGSDGTDNNS